jgi:hypothetical protein
LSKVLESCMGIGGCTCCSCWASSCSKRFMTSLAMAVKTWARECGMWCVQAGVWYVVCVRRSASSTETLWLFPVPLAEAVMTWTRESGMWCVQAGVWYVVCVRRSASSTETLWLFPVSILGCGSEDLDKGVWNRYVEEWEQGMSSARKHFGCSTVPLAVAVKAWARECGCGVCKKGVRPVQKHFGCSQ